MSEISNYDLITVDELLSHRIWLKTISSHCKRCNRHIVMQIRGNYNRTPFKRLSMRFIELLL